MLQIVASLTIVIDDANYDYEAKLVPSIMIVSTFIVQASFTIVTYDRQNMFLIQATGFKPTSGGASCSTSANAGLEKKWINLVFEGQVKESSWLERSLERGLLSPNNVIKTVFFVEHALNK